MNSQGLSPSKIARINNKMITDPGIMASDWSGWESPAKGYNNEVYTIEDDMEMNDLEFKFVSLEEQDQNNGSKKDLKNSEITNNVQRGRKISKKGSFVIKSTTNTMKQSKSQILSKFKTLKLKKITNLETYINNDHITKKKKPEKSNSLPPQKFNPIRQMTRKSGRKEFHKSFGQQEQLNQLKSPSLKPKNLTKQTSLTTINLGEKSDIMKMLKQSKGIKTSPKHQEPSLKGEKLSKMGMNILKVKNKPYLVDKVGKIFRKQQLKQTRSMAQVAARPMSINYSSSVVSGDYILESQQSVIQDQGQVSTPKILNPSRPFFNEIQCLDPGSKPNLPKLSFTELEQFKQKLKVYSEQDNRQMKFKSFLKKNKMRSDIRNKYLDSLVSKNADFESSEFEFSAQEAQNIQSSAENSIRVSDLYHSNRAQKQLIKEQNQKLRDVQKAQQFRRSFNFSTSDKIRSVKKIDTLAQKRSISDLKHLIESNMIPISYDLPDYVVSEGQNQQNQMEYYKKQGFQGQIKHNSKKSYLGNELNQKLRRGNSMHFKPIHGRRDVSRNSFSNLEVITSPEISQKLTKLKNVRKGLKSIQSPKKMSKLSFKHDQSRRTYNLNKNTVLMQDFNTMFMKNSKKYLTRKSLKKLNSPINMHRMNSKSTSNVIIRSQNGPNNKIQIGKLVSGDYFQTKKSLNS